MQDFSLCLREARKKAGFSQADCAHLLGVTQTHISNLECGRTVPTAADLIGVAVLFGRTTEHLGETVFRDRTETIRRNLFDLPDRQRHWLGRFVRNNALANLEDRVDRLIDYYGG